MEEGLETKFDEYLEKWREHCINSVNSSNPNDYINCDAYKNIVALGKPSLPLIRRAYDTEKPIEYPYSLRWLLSGLVRKIVGNDLKIPKRMAGEISLIEKYTARWLDENMHKYIQK